MELLLSKFMKEYKGELLINNKYLASAKELKEAIDNRVVKIKRDIKNNGWIIELNEIVVDNTNVLEVVAI